MKTQVLLLAITTTLVFSLQASTAQNNFQPIAVEGFSAVGLPAGTTYAKSFANQIDNNGLITFSSSLRGDDITQTSNNFRAAFTATNTQDVSLLLRSGGMVDGRRLNSVGTPVRFDNGDYLLRGTTDNTASEIIFNEATGSSIAFRLSDPVPEPASDASYTNSLSSVYNQAQQVARLSRVLTPPSPSSPSNTTEILTFDDGQTIKIVAQEGSMSSSDPRLTFNSNLGVINLTDSGKFTFSSAISITNSLPTGFGIFTYENQQLNQVVRTGDRVFGSDGLTFARPSNTLRTFLSTDANSNGDFAMIGGLAGTGVEASNNEAVFYQDEDGEIAILAREGDSIGIDGSDLSYGSFITTSTQSRISTNPRVYRSDDHIAFFSTLAGDEITDRSDNEALLITDDAGEIDIVVREGFQAPDVEDGIVFSSLTGINVALNDAGQVAFEADLQSALDGTSIGRGLFATDSTGDLRLVTREGAVLDVNSDPLVDDLRTVSNIFFGEDSFNDRGQIAVHLAFDDNTTGIFLFDGVAAVPEPTSTSVIFGSLLCLLAQRKRNIS